MIKTKIFNKQIAKDLYKILTITDDLIQFFEDRSIKPVRDTDPYAIGHHIFLNNKELDIFWGINFNVYQLLGLPFQIQIYDGTRSELSSKKIYKKFYEKNQQVFSDYRLQIDDPDYPETYCFSLCESYLMNANTHVIGELLLSIAKLK